MSDVTRILSEIESGDPSSTEKLLPLVYEELRRLAQARMASERADHTLQSTALVHEAYVRLVDTEKAQHWNSRGHFFAAAAKAMRRILIDRAREKARLKRGGDLRRVDLDAADLAANIMPEELLSVDQALTDLKAVDELSARLVELRYFAGMSIENAAHALGISTTSGYREWNFARAWLRNYLQGKDL